MFECVPPKFRAKVIVMASSPTTFLSYSHDSDEHAARVLQLADSLSRDGITVIFDRYEPHPDGGWPLWMDKGIRDAKYVLMVCTPAYCRRVMGEEPPGVGLGVRWEGKIIYNRIYNDPPAGSRYIPLLLDGGSAADVPAPVLGHQRYQPHQFDFSDRGYDDLYRHLTDQHRTPRPDVKSIVNRPPDPRPGLNPPALTQPLEFGDNIPNTEKLSMVSPELRRAFDSRKLVRWVVPALLALALVVGGIVRLWPRPPIDDPVEKVAGRLIKAYDHPLVGVVPPRINSPDFPYCKLRQAAFLTVPVWKGDANSLYNAIERLKKKQAFTGRDAASIDSDRDRLQAELPSLMQIRYGWLHDKVLPTLKASGVATRATAS